MAPDAGRFGDLQLSADVADAVAAMGYVEPTPIQQEAIPWLLQGRDLVGQAQTGTGKTAAFGIAIAEAVDPTVPTTQSIVLVPTRELAMQVAGELDRIGSHRGIEVLVVCGGESMGRQIDTLRRGAHVVVGTPGRVLDHLGRRTLRLDGVRIAVLDEADQMLDIGFLPDIEDILRQTPRSRQTALFSATLPAFVWRLIQRYQREPVLVNTISEMQTPAEIEHVYYEVLESDKVDGLCQLLRDRDVYRRLLVFRRTQRGVDRLSAALQRRGVACRALHGGMSQTDRNRVMGAFRAGDLHILVATNVAARGIDVQEISHVVNYDLPDNVEEYIHRTGRTGRAGADGVAVTFVAEWDLDAFDAIQQAMDGRIRQERLALYSAGRGNS
ncbi:MAG: DEAD/DEAH box helicase [Chloroflexi bacterium]|nr:DEAD/DEAH box helicase [Chloroflexota bacterium]